MKSPVFTAFLCAGLFSGAASAAETPPPLDQQRAWTPADKAQFLRYLGSSAPALPAGDVKSAGAPPAEGYASFRAARSISVSPTYLQLFPYAGSRYGGTVHDGAGGKVLLERHVRPWLRTYAGLEYDPLSQRRLDGSTARLTRWAVPAGVEFALVPLATPQTRYVLLRLGAVASDITGPGSRADFAAPVLGTSAAWDMGLGYEWQIADSRWRVNAAVDGLRSIASRGGVAYYGMDTTLGVVFTF